MVTFKLCLSAAWWWAAASASYDAELAERVAACARETTPSAFCWMADRHSVDTTCRFTARLGLAAEGQAAVGPELALRFDGGAFTARPHAWNASAVFSSKARLCSLADPALADGVVAPSVLVVANNLQYLFRLWPYLVNKALWARVAPRPREGDLRRASAETPARPLGGPWASASPCGSASSRRSSRTRGAPSARRRGRRRTRPGVGS